MREIITTGKTVEEATEKALLELGVAEEEVTIEVLELPRKKFLKTIPAKIRATVDAEEDSDLLEETVPAAAPAPVSPVREAAPEPQAAPATPEKAAPGTQPAAANAQETPIDLEQEPRLATAAAYLREICTKMGVSDLTITAVRQEETVVLKVDGPGAGSLIGRRGETMESLGYLTGLVANRAEGDYMKLSLDINNYRAKREANLVALAKRIAAKVAKTNRSQTLEPMNPYERRIIHSAVSEIEGVRSESVGEGIRRRVCILSTAPGAKNGGPRPFRQGERRPPFPQKGPGAKRPLRDRDHRDGGFERKSSVPAREFAEKPRPTGDAAPTVPQRTETVNDGADLPLYGKIEL